MRWRITLVAAALTVVAGACSGGPYTIKEFDADTGCSGEGRLEVTASGQVRALDDIQYQMHSSGLPGPWCEGLVHHLLDGAEISGYVFHSESGGPLVFEVTADGYTYVSGTGSVTDPDGKVTELP